MNLRGRKGHNTSVLLTLLLVLTFSCKPKEKEAKGKEEKKETAVSTLPLHRLQLPPGFQIDTYVEDLDGARSMTLGDEGTLFVGTRTENKLYAISDTDGDYKADRVIVLDSTLEVPNGVAFKNGALYVATINSLLKYPDIEQNLENLSSPQIIYDDYPDKFHHGHKYIAFGPDGKLYVPVGAPCNVCESDEAIFASITRMNPDGSEREIYAHGVRNTVGFTWHPSTGELWFTDNGRDLMGDDIPPCELNRVTAAGQHFGYPYCHGDTIRDPEFGDKRPCSDFVPPVRSLGAHVAPLAVKFYNGAMFPEKFREYAFIAEHGSWNRSSKVGYRISLVQLEGNTAVGYETFIDGWLDEATQEQFGRPVDILFLPDGSMLISDDYGDAIYRVTYTGEPVVAGYE